MQLKAEAIGRKVFDAPAGTQLEGSLTTRWLEVRETRALRLEPSQDGFTEHCDLMHRLTNAAPDAGCGAVLWGVWAQIDTGWILVQVNPEGA